MPPEFGRKWGMECLNTVFPLPTLQCARYSVKLKINETSSESSEPFDFPITNIDMEKSNKKTSITSLGGEALRETRRTRRLNQVHNIQNKQIETENDNNFKAKTIETRSKTRKNLKSNQTELNDLENVNKNTRQPKTVRARANTKKNDKMPNTSLVHEESIKQRKTQRSKTLNKVNKIQTKLNENENLNNKNSKPGTVRTRKLQNLEDQSMRGTVAEVLNTSLVIEEPRDNITEVEPAIKELEVKTIIDEEPLYVNSDQLLKIINKKIDNKVEKHSDRDSESPLRILIVEEAQVHRDADNSVKYVLLDNLKDMSGFNTTQNLTNNRSPPKLNIIDDFNKIHPQTNNNKKKSVTAKQNSQYEAKIYMAATLPNTSRDNNKNNSKTQAWSGSEKTERRKLSRISEMTNRPIEAEDNSDELILTTGESPITARGGLEGEPPNIEQLNQPITPRNLDLEYLNQSTQDFAEKLQLTLFKLLNGQCTKEVNTKTNDNSSENLITIEIDERLSDEMSTWQPTLASSTPCSVQNWLNRNDSEKPREAQLLWEQLEHMKEKLNTTLTEMQHASGRKFISKLVEAKQNANKWKTERRRLCQRLIADVEKYTTERLKDLETRFGEFEEQSIKNMQQNYEELVCDEYKQRKTMLSLLQDDLQNVMKHFSNISERNDK